MASYAELSKYEEMITAVGKFITEITNACNQMVAVGKQCAIQCDNDVPSTKAVEKLESCVKKFDRSIEAAKGIKTGLEQVAEEIREKILAYDFDTD